MKNILLIFYPRKAEGSIDQLCMLVRWSLTIQKTLKFSKALWITARSVTNTILIFHTDSVFSLYCWLKVILTSALWEKSPFPLMSAIWRCLLISAQSVSFRMRSSLCVTGEIWKSNQSWHFQFFICLSSYASPLSVVYGGMEVNESSLNQ